eukprot:TRINITY_DN386_c0_g1_i7.p1 TRINITY_DN386_c0_g1~~TRINITY_DN386_c0_g1_i7.p1  ORF type:complete len:261 (+),score=40.62 TRINITY_DN386_c0_g1_i7:835-1617(+)
MVHRKEDPSTEARDHLLCWWPLSEGAGTVVTDIMKNSPEGVVTSNKWWMSPVATGGRALPASTIMTDFKKIFNNQLSSDVQITVEDHEGTPLFCHKVIIASRCEPLSAMLTGGMTEGKQQLITLKGMSFQTLTSLIEFLYTDHTALTETNVIDLFQASDQYQVLRLMAMCEDYLLKNLDIDNVCGIVLLADRVQARHLRQFCINWILSNFGAILKRDDYRNLPFELNKEIDGYASDMYFSSKENGSPSSSTNKKKRRAQN